MYKFLQAERKKNAIAIISRRGKSVAWVLNNPDIAEQATKDAVTMAAKDRDNVVKFEEDDERLKGNRGNFKIGIVYK